MLRRIVAIAAFSLSVASVHAAERYTEARVRQIEVGDEAIALFLDVVSGDAPPLGNGGSNEPANKPFLLLAASASDVANRKHFVATAIAAQAQQSVVRFRWEDTTGRVIVMLVRQ